GSMPNASSSARSWTSPRPRGTSSPPWSSCTRRWEADGKVSLQPATVRPNDARPNFPWERSNEEDQEDVVPQKSNIIPLRFKLPGIKKLLLPRPADTDSLDTSAAPARAL